MKACQKLLATSAILVAVVAAVALAGCTTKVVTTSASTPQAGTVTAQGSGTVSAIPDIATMSFGVSAQNKDAKAALDEVSGEGEWTVDAARDLGLETPVIADSLQFRVDSESQPSYAGQVLTALRNAFGGHGLGPGGGPRR